MPATPGSPAIVLPKFAAPAFSAATVAIGAEVASAVLESTSDKAQTFVPFTFGQPFKQGELMLEDVLVGKIAGEADIKLQVDSKASHPDGSLRHAVISGVLPALAAGQSKTMKMVRAAPPPAAAVKPTTLPQLVGSIKIVIGDATYTASAQGLSDLVWLNGAIAAEHIVNAPLKDSKGVAHPALTAQLHLRHYPGAKCTRVDFVIEHSNGYSPIGDVTYDATLMINGTPVDLNPGLVHFANARWHKVFWSGAAPALHIRHDRDYLIDSMAVSNYDRIEISEALLKAYATLTTFEPMSPGRFSAYMPMTGGRPDIGLAPDSYAATIISMDKRAKDMMLAQADAAGSWGTHRRDVSGGPGTGRPMSIIHWPNATVLGREGDAFNYSTGKSEMFPAQPSATKLVADTSHQPAFAFIPYLLTGDFYYLEELHFWCNFNLYMSNPGYRLWTKGLIYPDQVRGQAWTLRTLAEAAAFTPDAHPDKQAFQYWMENNIDWYTAKYADGKASPIGAVLDNAILYNGDTGISPWQDAFFTSALGRVIELGFEKAKLLMRWKAKFQIDLLIGEGVCFTDAAVYSLKVRASRESPIYSTMAQCHVATVGPELAALRCNSPERLALMNAKRDRSEQEFVLGEIPGYARSNVGYPSNYQPALAMAVDSGYLDGDLAWDLFINRPVKPDYSNGPQFAIVPRAVKPVVVPPVVVPPVVVPPVVVPPIVVPPVVKPPIVAPPAAKAGRLVVTSPVLAGLKNLHMSIYERDSFPVVMKNYSKKSGDEKGSITVSSVELIVGNQYGVAVNEADGKLLAFLFPVIAT